jgi:hypothetical protein
MSFFWHSGLKLACIISFVQCGHKITSNGWPRLLQSYKKNFSPLGGGRLPPPPPVDPPLIPMFGREVPVNDDIHVSTSHVDLLKRSHKCLQSVFELPGVGVEPQLFA